MGGINGHLDHPYDIAKDGKELIQLFEDAIEDISKKRSTLKIDGLSMSVRLNEDGKFVIDRGSNKDLDKKGVRQEDLEERFGAGHGLIKVGKTILDLFDSVQENITKELNALGITADSGVVINFEFVDKKTNIINYSNQALIVHGLKMIQTDPEDKRSFRDVNLSNPQLLKNLFVAFNKYSKTFKMSGEVVVGGTSDIDLSSTLDSPLTLNGTEKKLVDWLEETKIDLPMITREEYKTINEGPKENLTVKELADYIIYYASIKMGDVILKSLGLEKHEGLIVTGKHKFKITGSFIIKNLESPFALKEEHSIGYTLWGFITPSGKVVYDDNIASTHRQLFVSAYESKKISESEFDEVLKLYSYDAKKQPDKVAYAKKNFDLSVLNSTKTGFVRFLIDPDDRELVFETSAKPKQKVMFAIGRVVDKAKKAYLSKSYDLQFKGNRSPGPMTYNEFITSFDLGIDLKEETNTNKQVVIIPGGFHPFHPGHRSLYQKAKKDFPEARVVFVATNKTNTRPFEFADKVFLASRLGIPKSDVILVNNPLDKKEMEELFPGKDLIFIRGQKEVKMKNIKTKYYPMSRFKVLDKQLSSATQIRNLYNTSDDSDKKKILEDLYGSPLLQKTQEIFSSTLNNNKAKN